MFLNVMSWPILVNVCTPLSLVFLSVLFVCRWFLLPCGNETGISQPICLSRDESNPCIIGYEILDETYLFIV